MKKLYMKKADAKKYLSIDKAKLFTVDGMAKVEPVVDKKRKPLTSVDQIKYNL